MAEESGPYLYQLEILNDENTGKAVWNDTKPSGPKIGSLGYSIAKARLERTVHCSKLKPLCDM